MLTLSFGYLPLTDFPFTPKAESSVGLITPFYIAYKIVTPISKNGFSTLTPFSAEV
jgi:hypothetical protein